MTLTIPPEIPSWVVTAVAGPWPQGDEDAMRRVGHAWIELGDVIAGVAELTGAARKNALTAISGETGKALTAHGIDLDGDLGTAVRKCYSLGEQLLNNALLTEYTKYVIIGSMVALVAQLAVDAFAPGIGEVEGTAATAATRITIRAAVRDLVGKLGQDGARAAAARLGKMILSRGVTLGAIQGGLIPLGAEAAQMVQGNRRWSDFDWREIGLGVLAGGAAGLAGEVLGGRTISGMNRLLSNAEGRNFVRSPFLGRAIVRFSGAAVGGGAGAVAGVLAVVPFTGAPNFSWKNVLPGIVGGVIGTMPHAMRVHGPTGPLSPGEISGPHVGDPPGGGNNSVRSEFGDPHDPPPNSGPPPTASEGGRVVRDGEPVVQESEPVAGDGKPIVQERDTVTREDGTVVREGEPGVREGEPVVREGEPVVREGEPVVREGEPVVREGEPVVREGEPVVREGEPVVREGEPVVREGEPVVREGEPVVREGEPVVREGEPVVREGEPVVREGEPVVREGEPVVREGEPVVREGEPVVRESEPVVREGEPVVREGEPLVSEGTPVPRDGGESGPVVGADRAPVGESGPRGRVGEVTLPGAVAEGTFVGRVSAEGVPDSRAGVVSAPAERAGEVPPRVDRSGAEEVPAERIPPAETEAEQTRDLGVLRGVREGELQVEGNWHERELMPPLDDTRAVYLKDDFIRLWENKIGRSLNGIEITTLERGCIGVSMLHLGRDQASPPMNLAFSDPATHFDIYRSEKALGSLDRANAGVNNFTRWLETARTELENARNAPGATRGSPEVRQAQERVDYYEKELARYRKEARDLVLKISEDDRTALADERLAAKLEHGTRTKELVLDYKHRFEEILARQPATREDFLAAVRADPVLGRLSGVDQYLPGGSPSEWDVVMFAKHFYSGQDYLRGPNGEYYRDNDGNWQTVATDPNPAAFTPNSETGQVDMSRDLFQPKGWGICNFDYGLYLEESDSWLSGNHMEYKDPQQRASDPMRVIHQVDSRFHSYGQSYDSAVIGLAFRRIM
ncbi:hypothetical protein [Nocardia sp. BMG111209]|uniref:WXG100-like domain-containing protein n=1 Tax=Nocardia sp. BMG111209 TaxID=1160137 RepID=UPI00036459C1|nr:hypothetical protein [Nocardia sp. BMG111209]